MKATDISKVKLGDILKSWEEEAIYILLDFPQKVEFKMLKECLSKYKINSGADYIMPVWDIKNGKKMFITHKDIRSFKSPTELPPEELELINMFRNDIANRLYNNHN